MENNIVKQLNAGQDRSGTCMDQRILLEPMKTKYVENNKSAKRAIFAFGLFI
jgi:hypothetical protein